MEEPKQQVWEEHPGHTVQALFRSKRDFWYLCLACPQIWISFMLQSLNESAPFSSEIFYCARGLFALLIAAIFFFKKYSHEVEWGKLSWMIVPLMTIAPFLAYYHSFIPSQLAIILAAVFGGIGIVWSYFSCIYIYSFLETKYIAGYVLASFVLASLVRLPISLLPFELSLFTSAPIPLLGIIMTRKALAHTSTKPPSLNFASTESLRKLAPVAIELAIYGIVVGMVRFGSESGQYEWFAWSLHLVFRTLFPLVLLWWIFARNRSTSISRLCQIALLCVITALLVISFFGNPTSPLSTAAATCARTTIIILLWLVLALLTRQSKLHPYIVFGIGWALYMLSIASGIALGEVIDSTIIFTDSFTLNLIYLLVVSTVFIILLRNEGQSKLLSPTKDDSSLAKNFALLDSRCEMIGQTYHLTKREIEVMQFIYKGRSKNYIAKSLSISEHTVRGYAKSLYAKLGIHNKQELLSLIGVT